MDYTYTIIDKYDELCDKLLVPIIKTGVSFTKNNEYISTLLQYQNEYNKNKIRLFFRNSDLQTEEELIAFTKSLNSDVEKIFFMDVISKILDLDDELQNYIISTLTKNFKKNGGLNYYEKKLYYNIKSLSEDDFKIFYCVLKKHYYRVDKENYLYKYRIDLKQNFKNLNIIKISFSTFSNLGILSSKTENIESNDKYETKEYFETTDYSDELYKSLEKYFCSNSFDCNEVIEKIEPDKVFSLF